jgi:hypothetical protein
MIPVVWKNYLAGVQAKGFYDQTLLQWLFDQKMPGGHTFKHFEEFHDLGDPQGVVLVTPGHFRDPDPIIKDLASRPWALVIVTSDEEGLAPFWELRRSNRVIWKHWPRPELAWQPDRVLPLGWTPGTVEANQERPEKDHDWFFAGQITHPRRDAVAQALRLMSGGKLIATSTFLQTDNGGINTAEYREMMRRSRVIPCPSGPNIPDTFRFYEALEAGAVPLADATSPRGGVGYWGRAFPTVPFPVVDDWSTLPQLVDEWKRQHKRVPVLAWWEQAKRDLIWRLHDDITMLKGSAPKAPVEERITVLMPTSPIPSHPDTSIVEQTVASIRERLPLAEIIIMADGVRPELEHRRADYTEYLERLVWLCRRWKAIPLVFEEWQHQANTTRRALQMVRTDLVLYVEHDTPLTGDIPWKQLGHFVLNDDFHVIRFHHERQIPGEHEYMMRGDVTLSKDGQDFRFRRTVQWSQRPHLARTDRYRQWVDKFFPPASRTMIEDRLHGIAANADWDEFRVGIYLPRGSIQRSLHLDGRGSDSKFEETMHV